MPDWHCPHVHGCRVPDQGHRGRGCEAKIETQGATGAENVITDEDLARADAAIIAADVKIKQGERFEPIPTLSCKTNEVMTLETALSVVDEVLEAIG